MDAGAGLALPKGGPEVGLDGVGVGVGFVEPHVDVGGKHSRVVLDDVFGHLQN